LSRGVGGGEGTSRRSNDGASRSREGEAVFHNHPVVAGSSREGVRSVLGKKIGERGVERRRQRTVPGGGGTPASLSKKKEDIVRGQLEVVKDRGPWNHRAYSGERCAYTGDGTRSAKLWGSGLAEEGPWHAKSAKQGKYEKGARARTQSTVEEGCLDRSGRKSWCRIVIWGGTSLLR